jgi:hypothetical protein
MNDIRFIAEFDDGSTEPFDVPSHDLRRGGGHRYLHRPQRWQVAGARYAVGSGLLGLAMMCRRKRAPIWRRASLCVNTGASHVGQNWRCIRFPLAAWFVKSDSGPSTLTASLGKKTLTVPARTDVLTVTTSAVACRDGFCLDCVAYCSGSHR